MIQACVVAAAVGLCDKLCLTWCLLYCVLLLLLLLLPPLLLLLLLPTVCAGLPPLSPRKSQGSWYSWPESCADTALMDICYGKVGTGRQTRGTVVTVPTLSAAAEAAANHTPSTPVMAKGPHLLVYRQLVVSAAVN